MAYINVSVAADHTGRRYYTYESDLPVAVGDILIVQFAKSNKPAIVLDIVKKPTFKTKKIVQKTSYCLPKYSVKLLLWLQSFYPYDWGEITKLFIPPNLSTKSRDNNSSSPNKTTVPLPPKTPDQSSSYSQLLVAQSSILHGVTGSGKTRVFLELALEQLSNGKNVLLLTPEIGLTPQLVQTIKKHCPYPVLVMHSKKTPAQRKLIWESVLNSNTPFVVVGPRSSLFLPYNNLGLIVADEAHDQSYKNSSSPRYSGIYIASKLAQIHKAKFIQSTATPDIADYLIYKQKNLTISTMRQIAAGEVLLDGLVVDLTDKNNLTKSRYLSNQLIESVNDALLKNKQALLFLNRRGSARVIQCNNCGHIEECPKCGVPITYHHDSHQVKCHLCNYSHKINSTCTNCNSSDLLFLSPGTKGLEQEIKSLFPAANIARFDLDTPQSESLRNRYEEISNGKVDIILGTQIISKGLDLPNLAVVGVLNADSALQMPDYRAEEVAFQQLYQVTGRVGRGHTKGQFIIQTRQPEHPIIKAALKRDYAEFLEYETNKRKIFSYPPYTNLALLKITKSKDATAKNLATKLADKITKNNKVTVLGPSPSFYHGIGGNFTWQIIIKSPSRFELIKEAASASSDWVVDIDPTNLL